MAITAASDNQTQTTPIPPAVHADNQSEYETKARYPIQIYFMGELGDIYKSESLKNLLPFMFDKKLLVKKN
jgi:cytidine deaminase